MTDHRRARRRVTFAVAVAAAWVFAAGCNGTATSGVAPAPTSPITGDRTSQLMNLGATLSSTSQQPRTTPTRLAAGSCPGATKRALSAVAATLPPGTSRSPQQAATCQQGKPLDVTYPATTKRDWTVTVKVTDATSADCQKGAAVASVRCEPIADNPGLVGGAASCTSVPCEQSWVFGDGYLVVVSAHISDTLPGESEPALPSTVPMSVSLLKALIG